MNTVPEYSQTLQHCGPPLPAQQGEVGQFIYEMYTHTHTHNLQSGPKSNRTSDGARLVSSLINTSVTMFIHVCVHVHVCRDNFN